MIIVYRFYYVYDNISPLPFQSSLSPTLHILFTVLSLRLSNFYFLHVTKMSKLTSVKINSVKRHWKREDENRNRFLFCWFCFLPSNFTSTHIIDTRWQKLFPWKNKLFSCSAHLRRVLWSRFLSIVKILIVLFATKKDAKTFFSRTLSPLVYVMKWIFVQHNSKWNWVDFVAQNSIR